MDESRTAVHKTTIHLETNPIDGGYGWVVVLGAFLTFTLVGGVFYSFGVLYVALLDAFNASKADTAWIGSLFGASGIVGTAVSLGLSNRFGHRTVLMIAGIMSAVGFVLCSFTTSIGQIYFTYGMFTSLFYWLTPVPSLAMVRKYFSKRIPVALGLALSGTGAGQFLFSIMTRLLLDRYGWRGTLIVLGGVSLHFCVVGALFRPIEVYYESKARVSARNTELPPNKMAVKQNRTNTPMESFEDNSQQAIEEVNTVTYAKSEHLSNNEAEPICAQGTEKSSGHEDHSSYCCVSCITNVRTAFKSMCDITLFRNAVFVLLAVTALAHAAAHYTVIAHMVKRGRDYGISSFRSSSLPAIMGLTQFVGRIFWGVGGTLIKVKPSTLYGIGMGISGISSIISVFIRTYEGQLVYVTVFGLGMACYVPMTPLVAYYFLGTSRMDYAISITMQLETLGAMLGSPFAGWLRDVQGDYDEAFYMAGILLLISAVLAFIMPLADRYIDKRHHAIDDAIEQESEKESMFESPKNIAYETSV